MKSNRNSNIIRIMAAAIVAVVTLWRGSVSGQTLIHRYNFTDDGTGTNVVDLVGGVPWYGQMPNGGVFVTNVITNTLYNVVTTNNELQLSSILSDYVQFPAGMITNQTAITVDMWGSVGSSVWGFLWCFGNTDAGGLGGNCIFLQPAASRLAISTNDPSYNGEQNAFFASLANSNNVHLTCVIDPPNHTTQVYLDGQLVGINTAVTFPLSGVYDVFNYIGRSLYDVDPYTDVTIDEYRVWSGALNGVWVAGCDVAGPDRVGTTNDIGTLTNVTITVPYTQLVAGGHETLSVNGNSTLFPGTMTINNNLCSYSSGNTNILTVDATGLIKGIHLGTANINAAYLGTTGSVAITVVPQPVSLAHRYSFSETSGTNVTDSVGGPAWNGTLPNGGTFTNGQLQLAAGAGGTAPTGQYVALPSGILSNLTAVSFDTWATFQPALDWNSCFFSFGMTDGGGTGGNYIFCAPQSGRINIAGIDPGYLGEQNAYSGIDWSGLTLHITGVVNPPAGYIAIYTNGVLAGINNGETYSMASVSNQFAQINKSVYNGDPIDSITINEFRIYNGPLSDSQVALNDALGPDVLVPPTLSAVTSAGNIIVSWSTNYSSFTLMSSASLNGGGSWSPVGTSPVVSGANYQVTVPATGPAQLFRLSH